MAAQGQLERLSPHGGEVALLLHASTRRLKDAANLTIHTETRLEQAYTVILTCALTALRAEGYRLRRGARQHVRTLETLRFTLALEDSRIDYYQTLRSMRHQALYEGLLDVSQSQLEEALQEAGWLLKRTRSWLTKHHFDAL